MVSPPPFHWIPASPDVAFPPGLRALAPSTGSLRTLRARGPGNTWDRLWGLHEFSRETLPRCSFYCWMLFVCVFKNMFSDVLWMFLDVLFMNVFVCDWMFYECFCMWLDVFRVCFWMFFGCCCIFFGMFLDVFVVVKTKEKEDLRELVRACEKHHEASAWPQGIPP